MHETLAQICALQPAYSSTNTPQMQERGRLIRAVLAGQLRDWIPRLQSALDLLFDDLDVEGSDGIGRKTQAPWLRLFSRAMSPNPREGFYLVIHFTADGSAFYVTVGCGGTVWRDGDLTAVSDAELAKRTEWARSVVQGRWGSIAPFTDVISLGASAPLPKTFEKATAFSKRIAVQDLTSVDLEEIFVLAAERLGEIYIAQLQQRDVSPGEVAAEEIGAIVRPLKPRGQRQGFGLSAPERRAVELQAMQMAMAHLIELGFQCEDTSSKESFDLLARRAGEVLKVEVKGTTSDLCDSVVMTRNEVELHRKECGQTALLIVSGVRLSKSLDGPTASGGVVEAMMGWDIAQWTAEPLAYQITRPRR